MDWLFQDYFSLYEQMEVLEQGLVICAEQANTNSVDLCLPFLRLLSTEEVWFADEGFSLSDSILGLIQLL